MVLKISGRLVLNQECSYYRNSKLVILLMGGGRRKVGGKGRKWEVMTENPSKYLRTSHYNPGQIRTVIKSLWLMKHRTGPILSLCPSRPKTWGTIKRKLHLDLLYFLSLDTTTLHPSPTSLWKGYLRIALEVSSYLQAYFIYFLILTSPVEKKIPILSAFLPPSLWLWKHLSGKETFQCLFLRPCY